MGGTCGGCRFARAFPAAGAPPVKPEPPKGWLARLFWTDPAGDIWSEYHWDVVSHRDRAKARANLVRCQRFPDEVTKRKGETCGEFQPAT